MISTSSREMLLRTAFKAARSSERDGYPSRSLTARRHSPAEFWFLPQGDPGPSARGRGCHKPKAASGGIRVARKAERRASVPSRPTSPCPSGRVPSGRSQSPQAEQTDVKGSVSRQRAWPPYPSRDRLPRKDATISQPHLKAG